MLGRHVFTADERFQILKPVEDHEQSLRPIPHQPNLTEWILQIQFVQQRDGGYYLCQVCYLTCMYRLSFLFYRKGHCNVQLNEHSLHCSLPPFFFSVAFVQETGLVFLAAPLFFCGTYSKSQYFIMDLSILLVSFFACFHPFQTDEKGNVKREQVVSFLFHDCLYGSLRMVHPL